MQKQTIIVFDGCDTTFKTPLCKAVSEITGIPVFKNKYEKELFNEQDAYFYEFRFSQSYITQFLQQTKTSVIFDRSWPSQYVYSRLTNRKWSYEEWKKIDQTFSSMNVHVVIPYRSDYSKSIDDLFTSEQITKQHELYEQFSKETNCKNVYWINVDDVQSDSDIKLKANLIIDKINKQG